MGTFSFGALVLAGSLAALLSGCTRGDRAVAEPSRSTVVDVPPPPSATPPLVQQNAVPTAEPPAPDPGPPVLASREADSPAIGAACTDLRVCGTKKRVALRAYAHHGEPRLREGACTPVGVSPNESPSFVAVGVFACAEGDRLLIDTTSYVTRLPSGKSVEAVISELTPKQLAFAQAFVGLENEPPLKSTSDWKRALSKIARAKPL
jgi:hypothetical protein